MARDGVANVMGYVLILALVVGWAGLGPAPAGAESWQGYPRHSGCVGGRECNPRPIEVPLDDRPVLRVRFFADDDVGPYGGGRLRVTLDGRQLDRDLVLDRRGRTFELDAGGLRGRLLLFEAVGQEEVNIRSVEVLYDEGRRYDEPYREPNRDDRGIDDRRIDDGRPGDDGWTFYRNERGCIGGELCKSKTLRIRLLDEPIERLRFYAHDDYGDKFEGKVRVYLDDRVLERRLDIERRGRNHDIEVGGRRGDYLVFEALTDDEVMIANVEVLYRGFGRRAPEPPREDRYVSRWRYGYDGPGECIGGDLCSRRHRIEVLLEGLAIEAIRFHAHSDVGERAEGNLRVLLDRDVLEEDLDIPRRGDFYQIDLGEARGRYLIFEAIGRGEVVIEDIEVRYQGQSWTRHRVEDEEPR